MMIIRPSDAIHKLQLLRLLTKLADTPELSRALYFKGGTCASMLGLLDRFSVDLDFDIKPGSDEKDLRQAFHHVFQGLSLAVADESKKALEFFLKYDRPQGERNTIKLDALNQAWRANIYEPRRLPEIDRTMICQTKETIVSNKFVAPLSRWEKHKRIAGRDMYDIHYFLSHGYRYIPEIFMERTGKKPADFFRTLIAFIKTHVTERIITEDLNTLLVQEVFRRIRKTLITETVSLLENERRSALRGSSPDLAGSK